MPKGAEEFPQEPPLGVEENLGKGGTESPEVLDTRKTQLVEQEGPREKKEQTVDDVGEAEARAYAEKHFMDVSREPGAKGRFKDEKTFLEKQKVTDKMAEVLGNGAGEKYKIVDKKDTVVAGGVSDEEKKEVQRKMEQLSKEINPKEKTLEELQFQKNIRELKTGKREGENIGEEEFQARFSELKRGQPSKVGNVEPEKGATLESLKGDDSVFSEPGVLEDVVEGLEQTVKTNETIDALNKIANKETPKEKIEKNVAALHEMREARERAETTEETGVEKGELSPEHKVLFQERLLNSFARFMDEVKYRIDSPDIPVKDKTKAEVRYQEARSSYKELTGRNLNTDAKDRAVAEAEKENHNIRTKREYFSPENIEKVKEKERHEMWSVGIKSAWDRLPDQEKLRWKEFSAKDEKTKNKSDGGERHFARQLEADRKQLGKNGFVFSRDAYFKFFEEGYDPRTIKQTGLLFWKKIEMKKAGVEKPESFKLNDFEAKNEATQNKFNQDLNGQTAEKMQRTCAEGRSRWMKRKLKAAGDIVLENTKEYQLGEDNKDISENLMEQAVRPEEIIGKEINTEAEAASLEKEADEEYDIRESKLAEIASKTAEQFGLEVGQLDNLGGFIEDKADLPKEFPIPREILSALRSKKREIARRRDAKKIAAIRARARIFRNNIFEKIADL